MVELLLSRPSKAAVNSGLEATVGLALLIASSSYAS